MSEPGSRYGNPNGGANAKLHVGGGGSGLAHRPSIAEIRRAAAVGERGMQLGLAWVPGVVVADVQVREPDGPVWMPDEHLSVRVWGGEGPRVWSALLGSPYLQGRSVALEVRRAGWWARARAWWRWQVFRLERAMEGGR